MLAKHAEEYRIEYNQIRPHEAIAWNRPKDGHQGLADLTTQPFKPPKSCHLLDAGQCQSSVFAALRGHVQWSVGAEVAIRRASWASSTRLVVPVLCSRWETCTLMVFSLSTSFPAISP